MDSLYPTKLPTFKFVDIFTIVYCGFCILELNTSNFKYICLILLVVWLISAYLTDCQALNKVINNKAILILLLYAVIYFIYVALARGVVYGLKYALTLIIGESPLFLFIYYYNLKQRSRLLNILPWIGFCVILYLCTNILSLIAVDPNAARKMAAYINIYEDYVTGGGYQIAYALCLLVPFLFFILKSCKNKIFVLCMSIFFAYTLIKCSYTIAILLAVFELFLLCYWQKQTTLTKKYISFIVFLLLIGLFFLIREPVGDIFVEHISPLFSGSFIERRMREFGQFIAGKAGASNGATTRGNLYWISIKSFFNSPFIGISYFTGFIADKEVSYSGIRYLGQHSTILDGFARIGISFVLYVMYYYKAIKYLKLTTRSTSIIIIGIVFFLTKILNVAGAFALSYVVYFAIPLIYMQSFMTLEDKELP